MAAEWWRLFNSRELENAVRQAIANNPNLQSAQASLRQSQENLQAGYGVFYPAINLGFSATRERLSPYRFGPSTSSTGVFNLFTLGTTISYTLDLFGGQRRTVEGLAAQVDYQRYTMLGTYMTLSGNVVNTVIARAAYQEQLQAMEQLIAMQKEQLAMTEAQATAGVAPYSNVLSIRSQLASNQATLPGLQQKRDQADHLLATLMGRPPSEQGATTISLSSLTLPHKLPVSLPSDFARQRPDILAAEAQLHASSAAIGVATADLFPSVGLSGSYGSTSTTTGNLFGSNSKYWSIGPEINYSLFQGGTLWYKRRAAIEGYQKSLADYRQTVLSSLQQVGDTLKALEHDAQTLQAQADALQSAEDALNLRQANYQAGIANYLDLLNANTQFQQAKINYLQARAQRFQDTTALFVALGGGWWNDKGLQKIGRPEHPAVEGEKQP